MATRQWFRSINFSQIQELTTLAPQKELLAVEPTVRDRCRAQCRRSIGRHRLTRSSTSVTPSVGERGLSLKRIARVFAADTRQYCFVLARILADF
jgi:hypothetical protein